MGKFSSHTSKWTAAYLAKKESETRIKYIPSNEIPVKSFDTSSMDFCTFDLLKREFGKMASKNIKGTLENNRRGVG